MSTAVLSQAPSAGGEPSGQQPTPFASAEQCPLCGGPIAAEQDWCLRCGAAARTRLAATPNWKAPLVALVVAIVLALGVLAAALVKIAGGSTTPPPITQTVTTGGLTGATFPPATSSKP